MKLERIAILIESGNTGRGCVNEITILNPGKWEGVPNIVENGEG